MLIVVCLGLLATMIFKWRELARKLDVAMCPLKFSQSLRAGPARCRDRGGSLRQVMANRAECVLEEGGGEG